MDTCGNVSSGAGPEAAAGDTRAPPYTGARAHRGKWVQTPRGARLEVAADLHRDKSRHGSCPYVTRVLAVTHQVGVVVGTDYPGAFDGEGCRRAPRSVGSIPTRCATSSRSRSHRGDATDTYTSASFRVISRLTKSANHRHRRRGLTFLAGSHPARRANPRRLVQSRRARRGRRGRRRPERAIRLRRSRASNGPCRPSNGARRHILSRLRPKLLLQCSAAQGAARRRGSSSRDEDCRRTATTGKVSDVGCRIIKTSADVIFFNVGGRERRAQAMRASTTIPIRYDYKNEYDMIMEKRKVYWRYFVWRERESLTSVSFSVG